MPKHDDGTQQGVVAADLSLGAIVKALVTVALNVLDVAGVWILSVSLRCY
jgi:hypothetical protein